LEDWFDCFEVFEDEGISIGECRLKFWDVWKFCNVGSAGFRDGGFYSVEPEAGPIRVFF
jgi:hypothetical protein